MLEIKYTWYYYSSVQFGYRRCFQSFNEPPALLPGATDLPKYVADYRSEHTYHTPQYLLQHIHPAPIVLGLLLQQ